MTTGSNAMDTGKTVDQKTISTSIGFTVLVVMGCLELNVLFTDFRPIMDNVFRQKLKRWLRF